MLLAVVERCRWLALLLLLSALPARAELLISEGYVRGLPPGQPNTAAFMRLYNNGEKPLTITYAASDAAELAEFHAHQQRDGMLRMQRVNSITIPAGGVFELRPGDHHLMLLKLAKPLREHDQVTISLRSSDGERFSAKLPVRSVLNEHRHH